jgi:hypothetical protein
MRLIDETGHVYSNLTVISRAENVGKNTAWLCKCTCGTTEVIRGQDLRDGRASSAHRHAVMRCTSVQMADVNVAATQRTRRGRRCTDGAKTRKTPTTSITVDVACTCAHGGRVMTGLLTSWPTWVNGRLVVRWTG